MYEFDQQDKALFDSVRGTLQGFGVVRTQFNSVAAYNDEQQDNLASAADNSEQAGFAGENQVGNALTQENNEIKEQAELEAEAEASRQYQQEEMEKAANRAKNHSEKIGKTQAARAEQKELDQQSPEHQRMIAEKLEEEKELRQAQAREQNKAGVFGVIGAIVADVDMSAAETGQLPSQEVGTKQIGRGIQVNMT